ncbi:ShlB/FhaC/HecB family hemolysin secretion/activation protein [Massilia sp. METH4]|uniref:ShlB/FhaC/HecB family hemolysin secretion/activation protein n=1 Tax=Massilia sp. METH4 TaxID=3123041 RepID=UPI0030D4C17D
MKRQLSLLPMAMLVSACLPALAQQAPDAGQLLQENARKLPQPLPQSAAPLQLAPPAPAQQPGGQQVTLQRIVISGNTRIASDVLLAALGPISGNTYDFARLSALAARVTSHYQQAGYPFARAYLPQQDLSTGELHIQVLEGRYGRVVAHGEPGFVASAQGFLDELPKGGLIESGGLERVTLLLNDQPGVISIPTMRPGDTVGTGDLLVEVQRDRRYKGEVGIDNFGSRATGRHRLHASVDLDSPFMFGDQISVQALYTEENMWFGALAYALPLGHSGLRGRVSYTHSFYELSGSFAALGARGTADVASVGLSYPLVRSQQRNLTLSVGIDRKKLRDSQAATATQSDKSSVVLPVNLAFDVRDQFLYAGITYGALSWVKGNLDLDGASLANDSASARTAGSFSKLNLDIARIQSFTSRLNLFGRLSLQRAAQNLDSSEKLGLGGVNGVRAYPNGEVFGDNGWVAQAELRYTVGQATPYLFYDAGKVKLNKSAWGGIDNDRALAGAGLGVRYGGEKWTGGVTLAWRTRGGAPQSEDRDRALNILANLTYRF